MDGYLIDLLVSLFFMSALVLTAKSRKHIFEENSETYKYISSGLVVLAISAVSRLAFNQGLFVSIPFLSVDLFYNLTYWILSITGIVLLANGITNWLPLNQSLRKYNKTHFRHLSLLKDLEQLIALENRPDYIFQKSLDHIIEHFDASQGAVFIYSTSKNRLILVSGDKSVIDQMSQYKFDMDFISSCRKKSNQIDHLGNNIFVEFPEDTARPELILPVWVEDKLVGLYLLWINSSFTYGDDQIVLKLAADIVGKAIENRKDKIALDYYQSLSIQIDNVRNMINYNTGIRDNLTRVVQYLKEIMEIDYASLIIMYSNKDIHRFTIGSNGTILCEKGLDQGIVRNIGVVNRSEAHIQIISKKISNKSVIMKTYLEESNMGTLLSCALDNEVGLLNIGISDVRDVSLRDQYLMTEISKVFSQYIAGEISKFNEEKLTRRFAITTNFLENISSKGTIQQVYEKTVRIIMKELRTSMVRIASFDEEGTFLNSNAMSVVHQDSDLIPEDGYMILSLMPTIEKIKETGETKLINQDDPNCKISMAEAGQLYSTDLRTALLVPILSGEDVKAIITLADRRNGTRFHYTDDDIMFVSSLAKGLSISLTMNSIGYEMLDINKEFSRTQGMENGAELSREKETVDLF